MPDAMEQIAPQTSWLHRRELWVGTVWAGVLVPLSCLRTLDALKVTNQIAIGCVGVVVCLVIAYALPGPLDRCAGVIREPCFGPAELLVLEWSTAKTATVFIFAFTCHQNIFAVCNELQDYSLPKVDRVITVAIATATAVYALIACGGYSTCALSPTPPSLPWFLSQSSNSWRADGDEVGSDILTSYPLNGASPGTQTQHTTLVVLYELVS